MAKRSATKTKPAPAEGPNPRQPCPCGSGKRYKACHGAAGGAEDVIIPRPFEGLAAEGDLVALREFVPSATAPLKFAKKRADREVTLSSVLPMAAAALVRDDGTALVGMQTQIRSGDLSRDLARAIRWAQEAEPGSSLTVVGPDTAGGEQIRLQDLLETQAPLELTLHTDFAWWMPEGQEETAETKLALERANAAIMPTELIVGEGVSSAYWVDVGEKAHLRWVRREPEEQLLSALARLSARSQLDLGENSRYVGSFRAHGLLVPVWDLDREAHSSEWTPGAETFAARLTEALGSLDAEPLTSEERRSRDGLRGRQITLR